MSKKTKKTVVRSKFDGQKHASKAVMASARDAMKAHNKAENDERQREAWYQRNNWFKTDDGTYRQRHDDIILRGAQIPPWVQS